MQVCSPRFVMISWWIRQFHRNFMEFPFFALSFIDQSWNSNHVQSKFWAHTFETFGPSPSLKERLQQHEKTRGRNEPLLAALTCIERSHQGGMPVDLSIDDRWCFGWGEHCRFYVFFFGNLLLLVMFMVMFMRTRHPKLWYWSIGGEKGGVSVINWWGLIIQDHHVPYEMVCENMRKLATGGLNTS